MTKPHVDHDLPEPPAPNQDLPNPPKNPSGRPHPDQGLPAYPDPKPVLLTIAILDRDWKETRRVEVPAALVRAMLQLDGVNYSHVTSLDDGVWGYAPLV